MSYTIRPEQHELRKARETVEEILESCKFILEKDKMLEINLGAAPSGSSTEHGAHGTAINSEAAQVYFNPKIDSWVQDLEKVVRKEYAKSWFYEKTDPSGLLWRELLAETLGLMFLEENSEGRKPEENAEEFSEEWNEKKDSLGSQISIDNHENFSWQIKYFLGEKILEEYDLEDFPELTRSDIEEAGEEIFE